MLIHKYEKWWLVFGCGTLVVFLIILGIGAFHNGTHPNESKKTINYEKGEEIAPFDNPGVIEILLGAKVKFIATTKDVIHGFQAAGTNINIMLEPVYISEYLTEMNQAGEYLILCNEYCGTGHAMMHSMLKVVDENATDSSH